MRTVPLPNQIIIAVILLNGCVWGSNPSCGQIPSKLSNHLSATASWVVLVICGPVPKPYPILPPRMSNYLFTEFLTRPFAGGSYGLNFLMEL
jgi:hypothetical protein